MRDPLRELPIKTAETGFYRGFSLDVTLVSKVVLLGLVVWAIAFPENASAVLGKVNSALLASFSTWYIYIVAFFVLVCLLMAIWPISGSLRLGKKGEEPEFSRFSWFSMMFGAGIGVGMLTFATAEPMYHWVANPETIKGTVDGSSAENIRYAYKWSFLHWGFSAWACYSLTGLALAFFSYRRGLPLTIRSSLASLFGSKLSGGPGHLVDIVAVVATILGVSQTLGFGVDQFIAGMHRIGVGDWLLNNEGNATSAAIIFALLVIMGASTLSALSGVGKGIKWLSNINMVLSFFLLAFFFLLGSTVFGITALFVGFWDYIVNLPSLLFTVWRPDGTTVGDGLAGWQGGWTVFYWAWWIAFAPFVGLFLARISKGRNIREYVLGSLFVPAIMCFVWFALLGGTAIDLELSGEAGGSIVNAGSQAQLFAMLDVILNPFFGFLMAVVVVVLLLTYLVTSADSAILIVNTINAAGDEGPKARPHIIFWGITLALIVGALLLIGGLDAIKTAMVIGALPFSFVMVLMGLSLIKAVWSDSKRRKLGIETEAE